MMGDNEIKIEKLYKLEKGVYFLEIKQADIIEKTYKTLWDTFQELHTNHNITCYPIITITGNALRFIPDSTLKEKILKCLPERKEITDAPWQKENYKEDMGFNLAITQCKQALEKLFNGEEE